MKLNEARILLNESKDNNDFNEIKNIINKVKEFIDLVKKEKQYEQNSTKILDDYPYFLAYKLFFEQMINVKKERGNTGGINAEKFTSDFINLINKIKNGISAKDISSVFTKNKFNKETKLKKEIDIYINKDEISIKSYLEKEKQFFAGKILKYFPNSSNIKKDIGDLKNLIKKIYLHLQLQNQNNKEFEGLNKDKFTVTFFNSLQKFNEYILNKDNKFSDDIQETISTYISLYKNIYKSFADAFKKKYENINWILFKTDKTLKKEKLTIILTDYNDFKNILFEKEELSDEDIKTYTPFGPKFYKNQGIGLNQNDLQSKIPFDRMLNNDESNKIEITKKEIKEAEQNFLKFNNINKKTAEEREFIIKKQKENANIIKNNKQSAKKLIIHFVTVFRQTFNNLINVEKNIENLQYFNVKQKEYFKNATAEFSQVIINSKKTINDMKVYTEILENYLNKETNKDKFKQKQIIITTMKEKIVEFKKNLENNFFEAFFKEFPETFKQKNFYSKDQITWLKNLLKKIKNGNWRPFNKEEQEKILSFINEMEFDGKIYDNIDEIIFELENNENFQLLVEFSLINKLKEIFQKGIGVVWNFVKNIKEKLRETINVFKKHFYKLKSKSKKINDVDDLFVFAQELTKTLEALSNVLNLKTKKINENVKIDYLNEAKILNEKRKYVKKNLSYWQKKKKESMKV